jgi:transposase
VVLAGRVAKLEEQQKKNSRNSSKPPSSDGYGKPSGRLQSRRKRGERKPSGQKGHRGTTLKMVAIPDHTVPLWPERCSGCGQPLEAGVEEVVARGQVFGLSPIRLKVTEYQAMADLLGAPVGEGTIVRTVRAGARQLAPMLDRIWQGLRDAPAAHFDETGLRVETKPHWLHVASTKKLTYYHIDTKRGSEAYDRMGILPDFGGTAVHDGYHSYRRYDCEHALCNAHHLRWLDGVFESTGQAWAENLATLLRKAQRWKVEGRLTPTRMRRIPQRALNHDRSNRGADIASRVMSPNADTESERRGYCEVINEFPSKERIAATDCATISRGDTAGEDVNPG